MGYTFQVFVADLSATPDAWNNGVCTPNNLSFFYWQLFRDDNKIVSVTRLCVMRDKLGYLSAILIP